MFTSSESEFDGYIKPMSGLAGLRTPWSGDSDHQDFTWSHKSAP